MRGTFMLLSLLLLWDPGSRFVISGQPGNRNTFLEAPEALRPREGAGSTRGVGSLLANQTHATESNMPLSNHGAAQLTESASNVPAGSHHSSGSGVDASTRGAQLGVQEPLSFYGNVHFADPMPVAEVPMWIWSSSTVICVLLLLLWVFHQRRFSVVAAQLRLIQRRCFIPPAALHMSLVYSFFPLSGAIAWLSLLEPRVGLLLSQLRSAWEVCCLHCFMLLMLHLMGGPETTLLLIQHQNSLLPPENSDGTLDRVKKVSISTGVDWERKQGRIAFPPLQLEQIDTQQKGGTREKATTLEPRLIVAQPLGQSLSDGSSSNNYGNRHEGPHICKFHPRRLYRRGLSAPNLLFSEESLPAVTSAEPTVRIPAASGTAPEVEGEELAPNGTRQWECQNTEYCCRDSAAVQQAAIALEALQESSKVSLGTSEGGEEPAEASLAAADADALGVTCSVAQRAPKSFQGSKCPCTATSAAGHQRRIRWTRARRASCFGSKSCQSSSKAVTFSRYKGEVRRSGSEDISRGCSGLKISSGSSPIGSAETQRTLSVWRRCREKLHRQRLRLRAINNRRSSAPPFAPAEVTVAPPSKGADRSPFEEDALIPACRTAAAAAAAALAPSSSGAVASAGCDAGVANLPEFHLQRPRESQGSSGVTGSGRSGKGPSSADRRAGAAVTVTVTTATRPTSSQPVVNIPPTSTPTTAVDIGRQDQELHKPQQQGPLQQQQRQRVLRLGPAEAGSSGLGAAVPGSTCSTALTSHGSSPAVLFAGKDQRADAASRDIHREEKNVDLQTQPRPTSAADAAFESEKKGKNTGATNRRIWFVPPLCCLAWNTSARPFSAWDLRMSYRCLLPFTVLKLLRVLLCYLLSTLMHLGIERQEAQPAAGVPTDVNAAVGCGANQQHLLQRLLQLCCFSSLVIAMWGLAVVFVATRPLLKPFNIGWKFTCLKALVFFIQLLELAAEVLQPIAISASDGAPTAAAGAQKIYVFTFLELLGSAICAVMATWAYKPGDLLRAHQRLLLLQKQLPLDAVPAIEGDGSCNIACAKGRLTSEPFSKLIATARRRSYRCFRQAPA